MAKDPVCGMQVDERTAAGKSHYQNQDYYFCSEQCRQQFDKQPERYIAGTGSSTHGRAGGQQ